jgi:DNA/RNA-binding domain of Phe-tRNA-synthetase-like protein
LNGKSLSGGSRIVTAMFMAEVKNMLLTAGHDMSAIELPIHIRIGTTQEKFIDIRGVEKSTIEGDMIMVDGKGVISSILLGPDARTKLTPTTRDVLFAVYAPAEVDFEATFSHLKDIENYVKVFSPEAETEILEVFEAR